MTLHKVLIFVFYWTFNSISAQTKDKILIVSTIDKGDYFYIPKAALEDSVKGVYFQEKIDKKVNPNKRPILFNWNSTCTDGYYDLTITPEQIFFSSSHDNPNPNYLFWVIDINQTQYLQIMKGLQSKPPFGFMNFSKNYNQSLTVFNDTIFKDTFAIPEEWTDSILKRHDYYCQSQIKRQLERYFSILNSYIAENTKKVVIPFNNLKPKYFSYSKNEIYNWIPLKFNPPKIMDE